MKNRNQKRGLLCALLLTTALGMTVYASEEEKQEDNVTEVSINDADMTIEIPASCYILEQEIAEDDPYLQKIGADREKIEAYFREAGIVLNAIAEDDTYEIVVTVNTKESVNYIYNMQSLSDEQVMEFTDSIQKAYESYGYTIENFKIYEARQAKYVVIDFSQVYEESAVMCRQYYTIRDSRIYNITLRSYEGVVSEKLSNMLSQVVESIQYTGTEEEIIYQNEEAGVSFTLREGWKEITPKEENTYMQTQYLHSNGMGESIVFTCIDIWGNMGTLHKITNTRAELDTQGELANIDMRKTRPYLNSYYSDWEKVCQKTYHGNVYLVSDTPVTVESESMQSRYLQRNVVTIRDGILYAYQYGYYEDGNLHEADFNQMLESITYVQPQILLKDETYYQDIGKLFYRVISVIILLVIVLIVAMFLYYRGMHGPKSHKKKSSES